MINGQVFAIGMKCDHPGCRFEPMRAPRLVVPSQTPGELGHAPMRVMTTLHFCERHAGALPASHVLTPDLKRRIEKRAKQIRPLGWKPDFDQARFEYVLVTTPEYRDFMGRVLQNVELVAA